LKIIRQSNLKHFKSDILDPQKLSPELINNHSLQNAPQIILLKIILNAKQMKASHHKVSIKTENAYAATLSFEADSFTSNNQYLVY
jgi:hypothetical protein